MQLKAKKYLFDIQHAAKRIAEFSKGKTFTDYTQDAMLRSAVERQFEIIGEALNQLSKIDPVTTERISDTKNIISFRNILIHGYAEIDEHLVWGILESKLPRLKQEVSELLESADR